MTATVAFAAWSDVLCPWCYVAAIRLHRGRDEFAAADVDVRIEWRAFLLRRDAAPRTLEQFQRYSQSWTRPAAEEPAAGFHIWTSTTPPPTHSVPPAIAVKVAGSFGTEAFDAFHMAIMRAYFVENRTVSERDVILEIASECGLDVDAFAGRWDRDHDALRDVVVREHVRAADYSVTGVPTLLVDDEFVLTSALPMESYRRLIQRRVPATNG